MTPKYLFVLCPPYSGSTALWKLLTSSPNVTFIPRERQYLEYVSNFMRNDPWNLQMSSPLGLIKREWEKSWDQTKLIFLEESTLNVIRAFEIEKHFPSSVFILMIQNPYTNCEEIYRCHNDDGISFAKAADIWVMRAKYQIKNYQCLENVIGFTYESLTKDTQNISGHILKFIPSLEHLDINCFLKSNSIAGSNSTNIVGYNALKIPVLSGKKLHEINSVLKNYPEIMDYFGYQ